MANILCLDFDDTIVMENTFRQVIERFVPPEVWERHRAQRSSEMTVEQSNAAEFSLIEPTVEAEKIRAFVRETAVVREGLLELTDWAHWNGWLTSVVSLGLDLYVDPLLDALKLDRIARHMGRTHNTYRWQVRYYSPRGIEIQDGFKLSYAKAFQDAGDFVVYVGDGKSDIEPARSARAVFARSTLLEQLEGEHPRLYPFETFHDVVAVLERDAAAWLTAYSSTTEYTKDTEIRPG
jgi:2-hydroxy-3-keto-5-methylthiopentenyl-1-phosphate phosphatase